MLLKTHIHFSSKTRLSNCWQEGEEERVTWWMRPLAQLLKSCCLSSKLSARINIPGPTQQLSGSKLKCCLLAAAKIRAHVTHTSVPRHLHWRLHRSYFPKWEAEESAVGRWKEPDLRMEFTGFIPPSWLQGSPRCCFGDQKEKQSLSGDEGEKHCPGKATLTGLCLGYSSLTFTGGPSNFPSLPSSHGSLCSLGETRYDAVWGWKCSAFWVKES